MWDIADPSAPLLERRTQVSGSYVAARMIGGVVHTVVEFADIAAAPLETWPEQLPKNLCNEDFSRAEINDAFLRGIETDKRYHNDDDRMCCHNVYDWLQAYTDFCPQRGGDIRERSNFVRWMPGCDMAVASTDSYYAVANMRKGGVTKAYSTDHCVGSDTGLIGELDDGTTIVTPSAPNN